MAKLKWDKAGFYNITTLSCYTLILLCVALLPEHPLDQTQKIAKIVLQQF